MPKPTKVDSLNNILNWWKANELKLPLLSAVLGIGFAFRHHLLLPNGLFLHVEALFCARELDFSLRKLINFFIFSKILTVLKFVDGSLSPKISLMKLRISMKIMSSQGQVLIHQPLISDMEY